MHSVVTLLSMSISVIVYLFSQANPRSFVAKVIALMAVVNEIRLLAFYSMIQRSSALSSPHRFPPYRSVQPKSQMKVKKQIICLIASLPSPGFKPWSAVKEASDIEMCHHTPQVVSRVIKKVKPPIYVFVLFIHVN